MGIKSIEQRLEKAPMTGRWRGREILQDRRPDPGGFFIYYNTIKHSVRRQLKKEQLPGKGAAEMANIVDFRTGIDPNCDRPDFYADASPHPDEGWQVTGYTEILSRRESLRRRGFTSSFLRFPRFHLES